MPGSSRVARLTPLLAVSGAALLFTVLLVVVRFQWAPLESVDRSVADGFNRLVANDSPLVGVLKWVTWLGSFGVLWTVVIAAALVLGIRRSWALTAYVLVTGAGALILDPVIKSLVGRLRPVVAHPVSHGTGNSFPSGHSLGSLVCYGAVLLALLPGIAPRHRTLARWVVGVLVFLIGLSRLMLGVHYLSDVIGAWALGIAWLGLTAYAFQVARASTGRRPVAHPVAEGLAPEKAPEVAPAAPDPARRYGHPGRAAAGLVIVWVIILGVVVGFGELIKTYGGTNTLGDHTIPHWLAAHRRAPWTGWSVIASGFGATQTILVVAATTCVVALAWTRRWRPVIFVVTLMTGEVVMFLVAQAVVKRPRPDVPLMEPHLPTFSYPSGHIAAALCAYIAVAILVIGLAHGAWRWIALVPAILLPPLVMLSRMYRGEHHPTDALGSIIFAALWIPLAYRLIRPTAPEVSEPARPTQPGGSAVGVADDLVDGADEPAQRRA